MASKTTKSIRVGFLNIMGQSRLSTSKQNQIEHFLKSQQLDILHLQETFIEEDSFSACRTISNNYQILFINNDIKFGVCSLVHKSLSVSKEIFHPSGRFLAFNIGDFTFANVYLPSGNDIIPRQTREGLLGQDIPNFLINSGRCGLIGGDFNCISAKIDCTANPDQKMSPNLKKLIPALAWTDTFRCLHPHLKTFSHFYNRNSADGQLSQGASRLDRSYSWGQTRVHSSNYTSVAFSDHLAHVVELSNSEMNHTIDDSPSYKPSFKISAEVTEDETFQSTLLDLVTEYRGFKDALPLLFWWDQLKKEVRRAAKKREREMRKERQSELNLLMALQSFLSKKVQNGETSQIGNLKATQLKITEWFDKEAEKVKTFAKIDDMEQSEKVRIFHHDLRRRSLNKSTITKLKTPAGIITGHRACSEFLCEEVRNLWENEALLNPASQEELLKEVEPSFTEEDNKRLVATITNHEIKESLKKCNMKAAPGTDSITYKVFQSCWHILGEDLCEVLREVVRSGEPCESMRYSYMIFSPKPKKNGSILPKDLREISLLNSDFKILSGVFANRLRQMEDHTISNLQYSVRPRKINEAICAARDAINAVGSHNKGCGIAEYDFKSAFDLLCLEGWSWRVFEAKGAAPAFINTLRAMYTNDSGSGFCIPVINNEKKDRIRNVRKILKQGDRLSCLLFNFSIDPLLVFLEKRLQGIVIQKQKVLGPKHPLLGPPPPITSKFTLAGYIDDLKTGISNLSEFEMADKAIGLFEASSGCALHRSFQSGKCSVLRLGSWRKLKQEDIPVPYMKISDSLCFLGVQLAQTSSRTRQLNGEALIEKVKNTINSFKAGRFCPLTFRPHLSNSLVISKIIYRASAINLRRKDTNQIQSMIKSFVSQDLLLKPNELSLYRPKPEGGLGLVHTASKCDAIRLKSLVDQGHPKSTCPNLFLKTLFRAHITEDIDIHAAKRPPYYSQTDFQIIKQAYDDLQGNIVNLPTKRWERILLERGITHIKNNSNGEVSLIPTSLEFSMPEANWTMSRTNRFTHGLPPEFKSLFFKWTENLTINNERLFKLKKLENPGCSFCPAEVDDRAHMWVCPHNAFATAAIRSMIEAFSETQASTTSLCQIDFELPSQMALPILFVFAAILGSVLEARSAKKQLVSSQLRPILTQKCKIFLHSRKLTSAAEVSISLLNEFLR